LRIIFGNALICVRTNLVDKFQVPLFYRIWVSENCIVFHFGWYKKNVILRIFDPYEWFRKHETKNIDIKLDRVEEIYFIFLGCHKTFEALFFEREVIDIIWRWTFTTLIIVLSFSYEEHDSIISIIKMKSM